MATLRNMSQKTDCQLEFKATQDQPNAVNLATSPYTWEHSGFAEARAGPSITESTQLIQDDLNPPADGKYSNQCLFVRTLNATVNSEIWSNCVKSWIHLIWTICRRRGMEWTIPLRNLLRLRHLHTQNLSPTEVKETSGRLPMNRTMIFLSSNQLKVYPSILLYKQW